MAAVVPDAAIPAVEPIVAPVIAQGIAPIVEPGIAPFVEPPSYDIDFETATAAVGTLPSLHPRPSHANIRALERDLFEKLETLQSTQSEEWGFRGLAEQPAEYALKSGTPWVHSPNPGQHRPLGLAAGPTRDAEAIYAAEKAAYQAQATVTRAVIAALNVAVPKAFRRGTNAVGGAIVGSAAYRSNQDPRAILLALRTTYGIPSPAERNNNEAMFAAPWNTSEPIETYFDRMEDCYVAALIASPPYTMEQMITRALTSIQLTGLYSQALIEWNLLPTATQTWDQLKTHFTTAYIAREQSGTGTTGANGYNFAANAIANDDALQNIEATLNQELTNLHLANNANHQSTLGSIAELRTALATAQQQLALLAVAPTNRPAPNAPNYYGQAPSAPNYYRMRGGRNNSYRGRGGRGGRNYIYTEAAPLAITAAPQAGIPPAPANNSRNNQPNPNKWYNNHNYCYSCGYDVPIWHTSATCNARKHHHQEGCTRANKAAYKAAGHYCSERNVHKVIMPTNPTPEQA